MKKFLSILLAVALLFMAMPANVFHLPAFASNVMDEETDTDDGNWTDGTVPTRGSTTTLFPAGTTPTAPAPTDPEEGPLFANFTSEARYNLAISESRITLGNSVNATLTYDEAGAVKVTYTNGDGSTGRLGESAVIIAPSINIPVAGNEVVVAKVKVVTTTTAAAGFLTYGNHVQAGGVRVTSPGNGNMTYKIGDSGVLDAGNGWVYVAYTDAARVEALGVPTGSTWGNFSFQAHGNYFNVNDTISIAWVGAFTSLAAAKAWDATGAATSTAPTTTTTKKTTTTTKATTTTTSTTPSHEHVYDNDCDADCNECGTTREVGDHTYGDWVVDTEPTTEAEGSKHQSCTICGHTVTETIPKLDVHEHVYDSACDADCNECGETREVGDHAWNEGEVTTAADKTNTGVMTYTCTECGATKTEVIPQTLRFASRGLTLRSSVQVNFMVEKALFDTYGYTNAYAVFKMKDRYGTENETIVNTYSSITYSGRAYYTFNFSDLAPDLYGNEITATLYAQYNGKDYVSNSITYSVKQYCTNMLSNEAVASNDAYAELRTLLVDLLNYGAKAQLFTNTNTDNLVNASLTDTQKAWGSTTVEEFVSNQQNMDKFEGQLATFTGIGLRLNDAVTPYIKFTANDITDLTLRVTCDGHTWNYNVAEELEKEDGVITYASGKYEFVLKELGVHQMREAILFTVLKGDEVVSSKFQYSVETYASKYADAGDAQAELLIAMMKYGDAAYAYVN